LPELSKKLVVLIIENHLELVLVSRNIKDQELLAKKMVKKLKVVNKHLNHLTLRDHTERKLTHCKKSSK
jgi:hypothetical protein